MTWFDKDDGYKIDAFTLNISKGLHKDCTNCKSCGNLSPTYRIFWVKRFGKNINGDSRNDEATVHNICQTCMIMLDLAYPEYELLNGYYKTTVMHPWLYKFIEIYKRFIWGN